MDGDSRGGAILSICNITGFPIKFIGISEKMADRILGFGDIVSWLKKLKMPLTRKKY